MGELRKYSMKISKPDAEGQILYALNSVSYRIDILTEIL